MNNPAEPPPAEPPEEVFDEFTQTVAHLRQECPWDKEQTHGSLRKHLLEEVYETLEAIDQIEQVQQQGTDEQVALASKTYAMSWATCFIRFSFTLCWRRREAILTFQTWFRQSTQS